MNAYHHILPLDEVKNDLRLDDCFTDDDNAIERMIASAFGYISKRSNHVFKVEDRTYYKSATPCNSEIVVYDYPINTTIFPDGVFPLRGSGYMKFCNQESVTLSVGYSDRDQVPVDLIEAALRLVKDMYYNSEEKNMRGLTVTEDINQLIDQHKRFML
jgi:Phage gp6-like head-tail connector protein